MSILLKGTVAQASTIRAAINTVRTVLKENDISKGVTTEQLYQLCLRQPAPEGFKGETRLTPGGPGAQTVTLPPHNDHPIRSKSFLKRTVLPALVGSKEIQVKLGTKEITAPIPVVKKGKVKARSQPGTNTASALNPITIPAWVWVPYQGGRQQKNKSLPEDWIKVDDRKHRTTQDGEAKQKEEES